MIPPKLDRQKLLRFAAVLLAILLALAVLVLIPVLTHREPVPERPSATPRPAPTPEPTSEPDALGPYLPNPNLPDTNSELQTLLEDFCAEYPGVWDIVVYDLTHGETADFASQDEPMISASLIKLFIMGAVFQQVQEGRMQYWDQYASVCRMIMYSDNYSANHLTNILADSEGRTGFEVVTDFAASIGCTATSLNRFLGRPEDGGENYTSAADCALLLKKLYRFELVSPEYSSSMLEILKGQTINDRIPAGLPEGTVCAHKTGDLEHKSCGDAGLVFSPGADYILAVICNDQEDDAAAVAAIAELSARVYAFFNPSPAPTEAAGPTEP